MDDDIHLIPPPDASSYYDIVEDDSVLSMFENCQGEQEMIDLIVSTYTKPPVMMTSMKQTSIVLDGEEEEDLEQIHTLKSVTPYRHSYFLHALFLLACILSLGTLLLFCRWVPALKLYLTHWKVKLTQLDRATSVLLQSKVSGVYTVTPIRDVKFFVHRRSVVIRIYTYRNVSYIYDRNVNAFVRVHFNTSLPFPEIHNTLKTPLGDTIRTIRRQLFGRNEIVVPMKSILQLFMDEVLHPFYIFQVFSCILWSFDEYYVYATTIIVASSFSAVLSLVETRSNLKKLRSMAKFECTVRKAVRNPNSSSRQDHSFISVDSSELVPGDIIEIEDGSILPCDIMLISGQCIVNEAMLTGESIPIVKNAVPLQGHANEVYSVNNHKNHTLYSGTQVVQTRLFGGSHILGICVRTGFDTAKGKLMLSILYPKPTHFKFYQDSLKFIGVMMLCGLVGIAYSAVRLHQMGVHLTEIILRALDVVTISVPPALPVAMTVGVGFAISRLKEKKIYCISPPRVNISGKINCMCFDKTGTLTEEGLDLYGVRCVTDEADFEELAPANNLLSRLTLGDNLQLNHSRQSENKTTLLLYAMASCHSLTYVKDELVGDPLEQKIFQATKWELKEPKAAQISSVELAVPTIVHPPAANNVLEEEIDLEQFAASALPLELGILRRFDFSSSLQRMSVVVKNLQKNETYVFVKGSPEAIARLSHKNTLPQDFESVLYGYAHEGFRVLACGYKKMQSSFDWRRAQRVKREDIESDLEFLGLIIMQNRMKRDTPKVIKQLTSCNIECIMVTGDNAHTAMSVARQCGIISDPNTRIFFGEMRGSSEQDHEHSVYWKDMESDLTLDPVTLLPSDGSQIGHYELAITGPVFEHMLTDHNRIVAERQDELRQMKARKQKKPKDWDNYYTPFQRALVMCHTYARMSPDQKLILSEQLQQLDHFVGFCGDGANDCGALKGSHVGVSLSEAEASIAAPFTSLKPTIACVPSVMIEGRAALQTSFQCFKYMACYSLIQFFTVILLYEINSQLGDYQFLLVDMGIILPTVLLMSKTRANRKLVKEKPLGSLINRMVFTSLFGQVLWSFAVQLVTLFLLKKQAFFVPLVPTTSTRENVLCYETTTLFIMSTFHTLSAALVYSISKPFKRPVYTNKSYSAILLVLFGALVYFLLAPDYYSRYWLQLKILPPYFRFIMLGIAIVHLIVAVLFERFMIAGSGKKLIKFLSWRKIKALFLFIKHYLTHKISSDSNPQSKLINAKLLRSMKKYNKIKKVFFEDYNSMEKKSSLSLE